MKKILMGVLSAIFLGAAPASAAVIYADTVIDYYDSGTGPMTGPYGGMLSGAFPVSVPLSYATDGNADTFVSLPTGSYLVLGFSGGYVFDGAGDDIFIQEVGSAAELADIYVSDDWGATFTYLGVAHGDTLTALDLATIGYTGNVNAIKVVGLDNNGGSPGFDLAFVQGLEGSSVSTVPAPAPLALMGLGLIFIGAQRRKK